jgi:hypothetical protein
VDPLARQRAGASIALLAGLLAGPCAPADLPADPQANAPTIGPLQVGDTFEQVRAATPGTTWQDDHTFSRAGMERIKAMRVLALAGMTFDAEISSKDNGLYVLRLTADVPARQAAECEQQAVALVTELEPALGPLGWDEKKLLAGSEQLIAVAKQSHAMVSGWTKGFRPVPRKEFGAPGTIGFGFRSQGAIAVSGDPAYAVQARVSADLDRGRCQVQVELER